MIIRSYSKNICIYASRFTKKECIMNKICCILSLLIASSVLINWGEEETTMQGRAKQRVNFYGTVTTQQGKTYKVDNIAIGRTYKKIQMYEIPAPSQNYMLTANPNKGVISELDLKEIKEMHIPNKSIVWKYQKPKGTRTVDYVEIEIISNDANRTKNSYLIDTRRKITCDQMNEAGPIEMEIPFNALQSLKIEGYKERETKKKTPQKKEISSVDKADE